MTERRVPGAALAMNPAKHALAEVLLRWYVKKDLTIIGDENLEKARELKSSGAALIFFPNHLSNADVPVLDYSLRQRGYVDIASSRYDMQGSVLDSNPITRTLKTAYNVIPIPSQRLEMKNIEKYQKQRGRGHSAAMQVLETGGALSVLAQGSRSRDKKLHPEKVKPSTAIYLDMAPNVYIIPVGIWGTEDVLPIGSAKLRHGKVTISFGEPVSALELKQHAILTDPERVNELIMADIMGRIAALLPEEYR
ncbi:hypothetical protein A3E14_03565 [Candidatus Curtissbacteria bacterium RIFCSPHIGHO2_12_FULL_41_13]|nr:MAG: hypothetical protein A3E14_03565 [Candidatus Curtissbacteria bacterium RIFCSPHIGHO2_12_FULL_41_13]